MYQMGFIHRIMNQIWLMLMVFEVKKKPCEITNLKRLCFANVSKLYTVYITRYIGLGKGSVKDTSPRRQRTELEVLQEVLAVLKSETYVHPRPRFLDVNQVTPDYGQ